MSKLLRPLSGTLALVLLTTPAAAQTASATIAANATVSAQLTAAAARALDFQIVYPGITKPIAATAATAGKFSLSGGPNAEVSFSFTLPTTLAQTSGSATLPIGSWTGCHNVTDATTSCSTFTPSTTNTTTRLHGTAGTLFIFVGATVSPSTTQVAGTYSGNVTVNAFYTGL